jgi:hypothetical protein
MDRIEKLDRTSTDGQEEKSWTGRVQMDRKRKVGQDEYRWTGLKS